MQINKFIFVLISLIASQAYAGECTIYQKTCLEGAETRTIDGFPVYKDCWKWENVYECKGYTNNSCQTLRKNGCEQVNSTCKFQEKGNCVGYEKSFHCSRIEEIEQEEVTYEVPTYKDDMANLGTKVKCEEHIKCIDGKCFNQVYEGNKEFGQAIAMLSSLKEMQKKYSTDPIIVFKGEAEGCKKKAFGLNNCCKGGTAWIEKAALSQCAPEDKQLLEKKSKNLCHYVGSYKKKQAGVTKYTKHNYCCFDSLLVKQVQVAGREKLGKGFGSARNHDCGGLTVEEGRFKFEEQRVIENGYSILRQESRN